MFGVFLVKHFISDYLLQGSYMLGKFKPGWDFLPPLIAHCSVHAGFTLGLVLLYHKPGLEWLALMDFCIHFVMDRIKAGPRYLGRFKNFSANEYRGFMQKDGPKEAVWSPTGLEVVSLTESDLKWKLRSNTLFWWSLGFDQLVHHLTDLAIIYIMVQS